MKLHQFLCFESRICTAKTRILASPTTLPTMEKPILAALLLMILFCCVSLLVRYGSKRRPSPPWKYRILSTYIISIYLSTDEENNGRGPHIPSPTTTISAIRVDKITSNNMSRATTKRTGTSPQRHSHIILTQIEAPTIISRAAE